jgi:hypothetical protein
MRASYLQLAVLSASLACGSFAVAEQAVDDRSYLPPSSLRANAHPQASANAQTAAPAKRTRSARVRRFGRDRYAAARSSGFFPILGF